MIVLQAAPSWDLVITLIFVIGMSYGFIMLRDRVLVTLLSLYAGTVIANVMAEPILKFFKGDVAILNKLWVESSASPFTIKVALFFGAVLLIGAKSGIGGKRGHFSFFELAAYSFFNVCIGLAAIFSFMDPDKVQAYVSASKLVGLIVNHQVLWVVAPLVVLLIMGGSGGRRSGGYSDDY
jgi:hypothetical protein